MGYFTDTMAAILEFKGDAELAYKQRRYYEKNTGSHTLGAKAAKRFASTAINSNMHTGAAKGKPKKNGMEIIKDERLGNNAKERMQNYSKSALNAAEAGHQLMGKRRAKSCKDAVSESFSKAFSDAVI